MKGSERAASSCGRRKRFLTRAYDPRHLLMPPAYASVTRSSGRGFFAHGKGHFSFVSSSLTICSMSRKTGSEQRSTRVLLLLSAATTTLSLA